MYNMGHDGQEINPYGVLVILVDNLHSGRHFDRGILSPSTSGVLLAQSGRHILKRYVYISIKHIIKDRVILVYGCVM